MGSEDIIPVDLRTQPTISSALYEDLIHYLKYATSAYSLVCPHPNGQTLVMQLSNPYTHIHGFIARDDSRKELVVALRGSASVVDAILDTQIALIPFVCPGCDLPSGSRVHSGFFGCLGLDRSRSESRRETAAVDAYRIFPCYGRTFPWWCARCLRSSPSEAEF